MSKTTLTTSEIQFANAEFLPEVVKILNEGHTVTLRLRGYSMRPFLENDRDKALLVKPSTIKVGDPVLAEISPNHFVLHRIDRIDGDNITLRGDGNLKVEHCKKENIVGAVIGFYRKGRKDMDTTDCRKWKLYSFPVRRYLLGFYRRIWIPIFGPI